MKMRCVIIYDTWELGSMMGDSSNAVGLIPGGIVRHGDRVAGETKGVVAPKLISPALILLKPLLSAMLLFGEK